jgi:hypothetical protein
MTNNNQKQSIELTNEQYQALMKAVYLGNWVANAHRIDDKKNDYEAIEDYVFSLAPKFGLSRYMDHDAVDGKRYFPTAAFENETDVETLHAEYDAETVWDELAQWLGEGDFFERYSETEIKAMSQDERFVKLSECIDVYEDEFAKHGMERVRIGK